MYTTQNNRSREIVRQRGGGGYRQIDVYNIEQQIEREIVRLGGGGYRQMYTTQNNRQIERQLDREEEKVATDRQMYTTSCNYNMTFRKIDFSWISGENDPPLYNLG